jgi:hypothetical protein
MQLKGWKKWLARGMGVVFAFVLIIICLCIFFGIKSKQDVAGYLNMIAEDFHPIWKDLALRRIKKGDSIESVLKKYSPVLRLDFPPYINVQFEKPFKGIGITAKNGKLISAGAGSCCWEHTFFDTPEENEQLDTAYAAYMKRVTLENYAYRVHLAKTNGQDVFISRQIQHSEVPAKELSNKYNVPVETNRELTAEVTQVVYGNFKEGDILSFPGENCRESDTNEPEVVFIHSNDSRIIYSNSNGFDIFTTVLKKALDWYQSLNDEQIKELVDRVIARRPKW